MSDYGSECKDIGANYILTEEQCKRAAEGLQLTWKWSLTNTNTRPKGCYIGDSDHVYFNQAAQSGSFGGTSICLKGMLQSYFD